MGRFIMMLMIKALISSMILLLTEREKEQFKSPHAKIKQPCLLSQEKQILCFHQRRNLFKTEKRI